jgi:hypothetical protein
MTIRYCRICEPAVPWPSEVVGLVAADLADRLHATTHQMKDHHMKDVSA